MGALIKQLLIMTFAVEIYKELRQIITKYCLGCRRESATRDCTMLDDDDKFNMYFSVAMQNTDTEEIMERFMEKINRLGLTTVELKDDLLKWFKNIDKRLLYAILQDTVKEIQVYHYISDVPDH